MKGEPTVKKKPASKQTKNDGMRAALPGVALALVSVLPAALSPTPSGPDTTTPTTAVESRSRRTPVKTTKSLSLHLALGNPSGATPDEANPDNFLMVKDQYCLSYNNTSGGPNWVSWHLTASDIGNEARGDFRPDDSLPEDFKMVTKGDYTGTKFDRGHVCNSKDRTNTRENNNATFLMTNILPQAPDNNQGPWRILEDFERSIAKEGNELYIYAGAYGSGGTGGKNVVEESIDGGDINVPKVFWKVIVVLPEGDNDLKRIDANTRTIAVCMPNTQGIRNTPWQTYVTTIGNIEKASGLQLISVLPATTQQALESKRAPEGQGPASTNPCQ
jgi:endonuclease G, mitochondrial